MVKRPMERCKAIIAGLNEKGLVTACSMGDIDRVVCEKYGLDVRTRNMYLRALSAFKFIRYKDAGIYEILVNANGTPLKRGFFG